MNFLINKIVSQVNVLKIASNFALSEYRICQPHQNSKHYKKKTESTKGMSTETHIKQWITHR